MGNLIQPFGEECFEYEEKILGDLWETYFFEHTYFVNESLDPDTYLIIGRRGSGKSSLAEHFEHQKKYKNSSSIHIESKDIYDTEIFKSFNSISESSELSIDKLADLWDYYIWQLIFEKLSITNDTFKKVINLDQDKKNVRNIFSALLKGLADKHVSSNTEEIFTLFNKVDSEEIEEFKNKAIDILKKQPIFILIDSREQYSRKDQVEMWITSALIQCASIINVSYKHSGVHIKVFVADEIFPYIEEEYISNSLKYIRNPLHLQWRPKDLIRLICWRFFKYLSIGEYIKVQETEIDWESFDDIYQKLWLPYFGEKLINGNGIEEKTLPYILRHTHLRPRQLIIICNRIVKISKQKKEFPYFSPKTIREGVLNSELNLANEVINTYRNIYPNCGDIVSALQGLPLEFKGNELDKVAKKTASQWDNNMYSSFEFKRLIVELGIIGRKKGITDEKTGILKAEFEFSLHDRLFINEKCTCVVHPMFYRKFNIDFEPTKVCVYPFPENPDFEVLKKI